MIRINKNSKLVNVLAKECDTPGQFIRAVASLQNLSSVEIAKRLHTSTAYVTMMWTDNHASRTIGVKACYNISKVLNVNPYLLAEISARYAMKQVIEEKESKNERV